MSTVKQYIAVDLGAESGRVLLGTVDSQRVALEEVHRFANGPIEQSGSMRWDFHKTLNHIIEGIGKAVEACKTEPVGIAVDSWGVDFGLIGADGELIENPYHYRDARTDGILEKAFELMPRREIYENTGIQFMQINTAYQLLSMRLNDAPTLAKAEKVTFMADLFAYHLCGTLFGEYTLASTSQMLDMRTGKWSDVLIEKLGLPKELLPNVVDAGTKVGTLKSDIAEKLGCGEIPVFAVGSHDTASAVAAVPAESGDDWAYLSSGTWSLMGVELDDAIINDKTYEYDFTNEGGVGGTIRLLKNIMGLWLVQECRRYWQQQGKDYDYGQLAKMAADAEPFVAVLNPNDASFLSPGEMPEKINAFLEKSGQATVEDHGQMIRIVLESLALYYRQVFEWIEDITGRDIRVLHMVGGGTKNELLCQFTAESLGAKVIAGPIEATGIGNILMQAKATGQIGSIQQMRELVGESFELREYTPAESEKWLTRYNEVKSIFE